MDMIGKVRRMKLRDHLSFSEIAKRTGLSRNTVKKWLKAPGDVVPKYQRAKVDGKLTAFEPVLHQALTTDSHRPKQARRSARALLAQIQAQGYRGGYSAVTDYVRRWRVESAASPAKAFVPMSFELGEAFQFDWSTEPMVVGGVFYNVQVAHLKLCASRAFWLVAYPSQGHEMLFDAHTRSFQALGGVARRGIYDNMRTAVDKVQRGKQRTVNARFATMCSHYLFDPDFCNVASGWEKGVVEKNVQDSRRRIWIEAATRRFGSFIELNAWLSERCRSVWADTTHPIHRQFTVAEMWELEKPHLMSMPAPFDGYVERLARVSSTCLVAAVRSRADVSFIAGLIVDKFCWHLPLYRQHQRLVDAGFTLSRPWLTQLVQQGVALLEPVYDALMASVLASRVKAMDETPIKAGRAGPGKMKCTYFWPIYGEHDEVCFPHFESRRHEHVQQALGLDVVSGGVLLTDGYAAYDSYARKSGITHAQCWTHARRGFFEAQDAEPQAAAEALRRIGALYEIEQEIRRKKLNDAVKRQHRQTHSKPHVDSFFAWVAQQFERQGLLPSNPFTKALAYVRERRTGLEVYLSDADVQMDTNHLERALRAIPMGRRNWLFCWTEVGAKHAGIVQSLIVTCRLHGIDPYAYFVDVLQRVGQHPAARVSELTPRMWMQHFAHAPLRSDLHTATEDARVPTAAVA